MKRNKKTTSGLIGSLPSKRFEFYLRAFFLKTYHTFFVFLSQLETSHFSYPGPVNDKHDLQSNKDQ